MASATTTAASVSITNLPTETLCAIFEDFVFDQMVCMKNHPVIVMEQVCVRWRTIASNTPRLWCHIRSHFPLSLITRMLRMSQAIPLRVDIDFSEYIEAPKTTVATILEHLPTRIHDLRIHTEDWFDLELCWHFLEKPAPFLVNLHMSMDEGYCRYYPWLSMGFLGGVHGSSTNAFKLSIEGIVMRWDSLVPQNLTTLTLKYSCSNGDHDITQSNVIELLRQCPNLEYLTLKILFLRLNSFRDSIIPLPHLRTTSHWTSTSPSFSHPNQYLRKLPCFRRPFPDTLRLDRYATL
ncbi:hypothetical protein BD410DRAFT_312977 [Rickenella mellea]|uniref:F-box domain-containing protein n=1 Tax=Rickenella mellea TaxID=50990 RepID=A0A4Y7PGF1_9AGAM|nr:hypothetical protein BD410DRAFT_312977 [Rickenella mellea]